MRDHRWKVFVLPFVIYMVIGSLEPKPPAAGSGETHTVNVDGRAVTVTEVPKDSSWFDLGIAYRYYPAIYTLKIALTIAAVYVFRMGLWEFWPVRVSPLAIAVGLVGGAAWIGLCRLNLEERLLAPLGLGSIVDLGQRSGFNPLKELADRPVLAYGFLAIRFLGLVTVVPIIEELFLRGFLVRFVTAPDWWKVPFGQASWGGLVAATVVPMLMHPAELFAAAVWFSAVSWLMVRTRNLWDCVAAHAITNLVLGIYVVTSGDWRLM